MVFRAILHLLVRPVSDEGVLLPKPTETPYIHLAAENLTPVTFLICLSFVFFVHESCFLSLERRFAVFFGEEKIFVDKDIGDLV